MQGFLTDVERCGERSCVWPVGMVYLTAGLDEFRVPDPIQTNELFRERNATGG
jgi:hypothetical protein